MSQCGLPTFVNIRARLWNTVTSIPRSSGTWGNLVSVSRNRHYSSAADMADAVELHYFFDPLCGWCYASAPALEGLAARYRDLLRMRPSGLFTSGFPVSSMADMAWRNDQTIQQLTGQRFTQEYRKSVLLAPNGIFDSWPATLALVAVSEIDRALEPRLLHQLQIARYVEGRDTSKPAEVAKVAAASGLGLDQSEFEKRLVNDEALKARALQRIEHTQRDLDKLGIQGVPQLVVMSKSGGPARVVDGQALHKGPEAVFAVLDKILPTAPKTN
ncbi:hypothetical protein KVR01_007028 [Diaporthe batatas]|uniref:uncharacterized protein n=1 Tax=Diaporthe batatas TaxID=748121 RepID=UPI001D051E23|nr:uncharacterized protein KVR01_007028 [Diaporthe batatas]KAG8163731.1 hypothetical protein KVR01_007028 [Diaporthe batatas]